MKAPFTYFGGKSTIAKVVWEKFGHDVHNFVDAFTGSASICLLRPGWYPGKIWDETVNDTDGLLTNFWRSIKFAPEETAKFADMPAMENEMHSAHAYLIDQKEFLRSKLEGSIDFYDAKAAGLWVYGISSWIGGSFCSGKGAWGVEKSDDGNQYLVKKENGILYRKRIRLDNSGINKNNINIYAWFKVLSDRFKHVKITCGDWKRVTSDFSVSKKNKYLTAVFLDPPYSKESGREKKLYSEENLMVAHEVREWCKTNSTNKNLRIALCGYDTEHSELENMGWVKYSWHTNGGYSVQAKITNKGKENRKRETVWFSPYCFNNRQIFII